MPRFHARPWLAALTLAVVSVATLAQAARKRHEPAPASAPAGTSAAAPTAPAAATGASAPATTGRAAGASATQAPRRLDPAKAKGKATLQVSLAAPLRMGGFGFTATYDPARFAVSEPVKSPALDGYTCASNLTEPGTIRFNCAGLVNEDRGGTLATFDVAYADKAPTLADFSVSKTELVDDKAVAVPAGLVVSVAPSGK